MAINKNHEFEELDGVKCAIVEKNVSPERVAFLKDLLEFNGYTVVVVASPPPKVAAPPPKPAVPAAPAASVVTGEENSLPVPVQETTVPPPPPPPPPPPESFTVGVTDVRFNPTNAIFGRLLKTRENRIVTLAYWYQKEKVSNDEIPYFE
jgi:hypothetical protein